MTDTGYRSAISHEIEGDASFGGVLPATTGTADLDLPATAGLGVWKKLGDSFAVKADVAWTDWSRFDELRIGPGMTQRIPRKLSSWKPPFPSRTVVLVYFTASRRVESRFSTSQQAGGTTNVFGSKPHCATNDSRESSPRSPTP